MARRPKLIWNAVPVVAGAIWVLQILTWLYIESLQPNSSGNPMFAGGHDGVQPMRPNQKSRRRKNGEKVKMEIERPSVPTAKTISPYLRHPLFKGKERLLTMLHEAHYFNDSAPEFFEDEARVEALANKLPTWETVSRRLGGEAPVIVGLDTCAKYQSLVPPIERLMGVSGIFATGTNLLASLLVANCHNDVRWRAGLGAGVRWQVNWGKHSPARFRLENKLDEGLVNENYLPVVTIRHPYSWMQSLCRQRYSTHWFHSSQEHCPNLVPNDIDRKWYNFTMAYGRRGVHSLFNDPWLRDNLLDTANFTLDSSVVPVRVRYKSGTLYHESLAAVWNEWYRESYDAEYPRIIVRLEDLVFHAKEVVTKVCECFGGKMDRDFLYVTKTAKVGDANIHGSDRTDLFKWFTRWHLEDRVRNMTREDQEYAREHLDQELLKQFQYGTPEL
jgi:hypothetical protein